MRKVIILLSLLLVAATVFTGCGRQQEQQVEQPPKVYRYADGGDVSNISPHMSLAAFEGDVVWWMTGALYRRVPLADRSGSHDVPELAADFPQPVGTSGLIWNIPIRRNAQWIDGTPINADTFMYSYRMMLDPNMGNVTAWMLYDYLITIRGAQEYYFQNRPGNAPVRWEDVGIRKIDDYTIQIEATMRHSQRDVMRHFQTRGAQPVHEGLYERFMNADRTATTYGTDLDSVISSGPFYISHWVKDSQRVFSRNDNWVLADQNLIKLDQVNVRMVPDANTRMQLFEAGELDYIGLTNITYPLYAEDPRVRRTMSSETTNIEINTWNTEKPILNDLEFRQALFYATDRQTLGDLSTHRPWPMVLTEIAGAYPAEGILFRDLPQRQAYFPANYGYDPDRAVRLFNSAMARHGLDSIHLTMHVSETATVWMLQAEYLQFAWAELFGRNRFSMELITQPYQMHMDAMKAFQTNPNAYELGWAGWLYGEVTNNPTIMFLFYQSEYDSLNAPHFHPTIDDAWRRARSEEYRLSQDRLVEMALVMDRYAYENVIVIPTIQIEAKFLISERMWLPVDEFDAIGIGWGTFWADVYW
ncbi:MAG: ABC transporter substrate-binding protein [Treponema sp.]|nr:ABC transporter substrate-binding protein [Treponema sp.]